MTTSVSPVTNALSPSTAPLVLQPAPFNPMAVPTQGDAFSLSQPVQFDQPKRGWVSWGIGAAMNLTRRVINGVRNVLGMFMPGQIGQTLKNTAISTAALSVFSFFLTGPFHLPALPLYAVASLGFDAAYKFITGMFPGPNRAALQQLQQNQLSFISPDKRSALVL